MSDVLVKLQKKSEEDEKGVKSAQDHFHAVSAGLSSNDDGEDQTLADQLLGMYLFKLNVERGRSESRNYWRGGYCIFGQSSNLGKEKAGLVWPWIHYVLNYINTSILAWGFANRPYLQL